MWFVKNIYAIDEKAASQMVKFFHRELLPKCQQFSVKGRNRHLPAFFGIRADIFPGQHEMVQSDMPQSSKWEWRNADKEPPALQF